MSKKNKPINLVKHRTGFNLQINLRNYQELADMQKGLLSGLRKMRYLDEIEATECVYWIARILSSSISFEDYKLWDRLEKKATKKSK